MTPFSFTEIEYLSLQFNNLYVFHFNVSHLLFSNHLNWFNPFLTGCQVGVFYFVNNFFCRFNSYLYICGMDITITTLDKDFDQLCQELALKTLTTWGLDITEEDIVEIDNFSDPYRNLFVSTTKGDYQLRTWNIREFVGELFFEVTVFPEQGELQID